MGNRREINPHEPTAIEQAYQIQNAREEERRQYLHTMHHLFGSRFDNHISGRPHWINGWLGGILTNLGNRRR